MEWNPWVQRHCTHRKMEISRWFEGGVGMACFECVSCGQVSRGPVIDVVEPSSEYPQSGINKQVRERVYV